MLACNNKITNKKEIDGLAVFSGTHTKLTRLVNGKKYQLTSKRDDFVPRDHLITTVKGSLHCLHVSTKTQNKSITIITITVTLLNIKQGTLTEGKGSVQLISSLRSLVL